LIIWLIAALLGLATGMRIGWALVHKQSVVSTAMIVALGSLATVAALNWRPLTLLVDDVSGWPNLAMGLSEVALVACAAGSCVMITAAASTKRPTTVRRVAAVQYAVAGVVAVVALARFFGAGRQPEMTTEEYLSRTLGAQGATLPWLVPLLYVMLASTLVAWAGLRYSNRSRRGRALFLFTVGIVLIVLASVFVLLRAVAATELVGIGSAATLLGAAMVVVAAGSLLPSLEDWFGARRELAVIEPLLTELSRRQPDLGIGERPRGPLVFRVAERMSLISDGLYLEATAAEAARRKAPARAAAGCDRAEEEADGPAGDAVVRDGGTDGADELDPEPVPVPPEERAAAIAAWIHAGRGGAHGQARRKFPGMAWLRQPESYSDREWILAIADRYRDLVRADEDEVV